MGTQYWALNILGLVLCYALKCAPHSMSYMILLRTRYSKMEAIFQERTEALAADAAADEQVALDSWLKTNQRKTSFWNRKSGKNQ